MRLNGQPSRPNAMTWCRFSSLKTLLTSTEGIPHRCQCPSSVPLPVFSRPSLAGFERPPRTHPVSFAPRSGHLVVRVLGDHRTGQLILRRVGRCAALFGRVGRGCQLPRGAPATQTASLNRHRTVAELLRISAKRNGNPLEVAGHPVTTVAGRRLGICVCYEQLLIWPVLVSMLNRPRMLVAIANDDKY
jgi:hypothetical protein